MRKFYFLFTFLSASSERNQRDDQGEGRLRSLPSPWNPISFKRLFVLTSRSSLPALSAFRTLRSAWLFGHLFLRTSHTFGLFAPIFANKKLKMHLRELSREFPVPKTARLLMRARFLRAVPSYHGFSFFFLERLSSFFLKRRKKDAEKILVQFLLNISVLIKHQFIL